MKYKDYNFVQFKLRVNKKKLDELNKKLAPGKSWWAFIGILLFFFLPELVAFFWGDRITAYFSNLENNASDSLHKFLYRQLKGFGQNSIFNISLGLIFIVWFFKARKKDN